MPDTSSSRIPDTTMDAIRGAVDDLIQSEREYAEEKDSAFPAYKASLKKRRTEFRAALLSRLETLTKERGAYSEVLAENEKLTVENGSLYRRLEARERELAEAQEKFRALGEAYNFLYHEHGACATTGTQENNDG